MNCHNAKTAKSDLAPTHCQTAKFFNLAVAVVRPSGNDVAAITIWQEKESAKPLILPAKSAEETAEAAERFATAAASLREAKAAYAAARAAIINDWPAGIEGKVEVIRCPGISVTTREGKRAVAALRQQLLADGLAKAYESHTVRPITP